MVFGRIIGVSRYSRSAVSGFESACDHWFEPDSVAVFVKFAAFCAAAATRHSRSSLTSPMMYSTLSA